MIHKSNRRNDRSISSSGIMPNPVYLSVPSTEYKIVQYIPTTLTEPLVIKSFFKETHWEHN